MAIALSLYLCGVVAETNRKYVAMMEPGQSATARRHYGKGIDAFNAARWEEAILHFQEAAALDTFYRAGREYVCMSVTHTFTCSQLHVHHMLPYSHQYFPAYSVQALCTTWRFSRTWRVRRIKRVNSSNKQCTSAVQIQVPVGLRSM